MIIGGFQRFSLIDFPGKICAIVFTQGCNFRCPYCHNPELVDATLPAAGTVSDQEVISFLERRKGKLDAVTITGGEPLMQPDLEDFLSRVRALGYLIKLDTNGSFPRRLEGIILSESVDYLAMDIKATPEKYRSVIRKEIDISKILESITLIKNSGLDHEFRTTVVKPLLERKDFFEIGRLAENCKLYALQKFVPSKTLDEEFLTKETYSDEELDDFKAIMDTFVQKCIVR
jgi:pyruvate formate lyase activating enzyme